MTDFVISLKLDNVYKRDEEIVFKKFVSLLHGYFVNTLKYNPFPKAKYEFSKYKNSFGGILTNHYTFSSQEDRCVFSFSGEKIREKNDYEDPKSYVGKFRVTLVFSGGYFRKRPDDFSFFFEKIFSYLTEYFDKKDLLEFDSGEGIALCSSAFYFCRDFKTFFKATVEERWRYRLSGYDKKKLRKFMIEKGMVDSDGQLLISRRNPPYPCLLFILDTFFSENFAEKKLPKGGGK
ncbi:MAG: hypothetical protein H6500_04595 [Candidatus Woesearchaeota archaeon]|nr:MAG: hypothetical protein H6500_04595 [Candidatus Woesearchaeota archaeon]